MSNPNFPNFPTGAGGSPWTSGPSASPAPAPGWPVPSGQHGPGQPGAPLPPAPPGTAGFCTHCGTPFATTSGPFCRKCGNRVRTQAPVATNYTYPTMPASWVPAAHRKLGHVGFIFAAVGALAVIVVAISAAAVANKPTTSYCHFFCGPQVGSRLLGQTAYDNSKFGYRVEYESPPFSVGGQNASGVLLAANQSNFILITAESGGDVAGAIKTALSDLSSNEFQDMQEVSSVVPGAEIGFIPGSGVVYNASLVPAGGGEAQTVVIVCMAASNGNMTLTALAVAPQDLSSVSQLPFGFANATLFDFEVSNTIWPGQS